MRGERWESWNLKAVALGAPLPEVPSWARRDPRLADYEWAVIAALAERIGDSTAIGIVTVTVAQIARQIIDPSPSRAEVAELAAAAARLERLGVIATGKGTMVLRPRVLPIPTALVPRPCSDEALLEWIDTLSEPDQARARKTLAWVQAALRGEASAA